MEIKEILYICGSLVFVVMGMIGFVKIIKEIRIIKMSPHDSVIKAKVINWHIFTTGDIRPILSYTVNGQTQIYEFHFFHSRKEYPIGEMINLKLSNASGLAYDKKDLIQGLLMTTFSLLLFVVAFIVLIW